MPAVFAGGRAPDDAEDPARRPQDYAALIHDLIAAYEGTSHPEAPVVLNDWRHRGRQAWPRRRKVDTFLPRFAPTPPQPPAREAVPQPPPPVAEFGTGQIAPV